MTETIKRTRTEAERQVARYNLLTTGRVAERLSDDEITADRVRAWIEAGELKAVDARRPGAKHPRYMVEWEWVETFLKRRAVGADAA